MQIPNFPIVTESTWQVAEDSTADRILLVDTLRTMLSEGKTDGIVYQDTWPPPCKCYRVWSDENAANEFVTFMTTSFPWTANIDLKISAGELPWNTLEDIPVMSDIDQLASHI